MAKLASALARKTPLRKGMTRRRAAALVFVLTGPPSYQSFVLEARARRRATGCAGSPPRCGTTCSAINQIRPLVEPPGAAGRPA